MSISTLQSLNGTAATGAVGKSASVQAGGDATSTQTKVTKDVYMSDLSDIAAKYDVRHVSPQQIPTMVKELSDKGLISDNACLGLLLLPHLMADGDVGAAMAMGSDGSVDLLKYWKNTYTNVTQPSQEATASVEGAMNLFKALSQYPHEKSTASKSAVSAQSVVNVRGASSYADAISKSTVDTQHVMNVLEALSVHSQDTSSSGKV